MRGCLGLGAVVLAAAMGLLGCEGSHRSRELISKTSGEVSVNRPNDALTHAAAQEKTTTPTDPLAVLHPPPIRLHVKDADLNQVAAALTVATGTKIQAYTELRGSGRFTLDADDKPFWEIVQALNAQSPIHVMGFHDEFSLSTGLGWEQVASKGPFFLYASRGIMAPVAAGVMGRVAGRPARPVLRYTLAADPRTPLLGMRLRITLWDKAGHEILAARPWHLLDRCLSLDGNYYDDTFELEPYVSQNPGAIIATIKVHAQFVVPLTTAQVEIADVQRKLDLPFQAGRSTISVSWSDVQLNSLGGQLGITTMNGNEDGYAAYRLLDADGNICDAHTFLGSIGAGTNPDEKHHGPFTMQVRAAQEAKLVDVDFELPQPMQ
ncbi:MAG TPA: hypothetical protein VGN88_01255 [Phycisphaerae bacterium]